MYYENAIDLNTVKTLSGLFKQPLHGLLKVQDTSSNIGMKYLNSYSYVDDICFSISMNVSKGVSLLVDKFLKIMENPTSSNKIARDNAR